MPAERPTVAMADTDSKSEFRKSAFSTREMIVPTVRDRERYNVKIHNTFLETWSSSLLPNTSVDFLFLNVVMTDNKSTAKVVVLIPPAVEPGEPPIIISTNIINRPLSVNAARSTVLKPAVLGATD